MPFSSIKLQPTVNTVMTPTLNDAGISKSNLIRFRQGLVEKMGGWMRYVQSATASITRDLHAWQDLSGATWLGVGGTTSLSAIRNGLSTSTITPQYFFSNVTLNFSTTAGSNVVTIIDGNITGNLTVYDSVLFDTPITIGGITLTGLYPISVGGVGTYQIKIASPAITTVANAGAVPSFTTTANSNVVTVSFANHNLNVGGSFNFPIPTLLGGVGVSGSYTVVTVPTANSFTITLSGTATFGQTVSMNSGKAALIYYIAISSSGTVTRTGPPGPIGQFAIGEDYSSITSVTDQAGTGTITATTWTSDNWGEVYLACPQGGGVYYWGPESGFTTAVLIGTAPYSNNGIFVAMPQQILVCWGSTYGTNNPIGGGSLRQDPLIVRWSDQLDFTNFTVSSTTQAGSFHIPTGSVIRGGLQAATQALIWTDIDVWGMQYIGYPLVFGFNQLGSGCGLIGAHGAVDFRGTTYWMNQSNFFVLDSRGVRPLDCSVWDNVFQDLDTFNSWKCVAAKNSIFNEIMFFYPSLSGGTGECDKYVKYNVLVGSWDYGSLPRSAWVDQSVVGNPIGADPTTLLLQQHETGYSADGGNMDSFFETGYFDVGDGENFAVVDHFEPDAKWTTFNGSTSARIQVTLSAQKYPNDTVYTNPTLTMTSTSTYLTPRLRGRQMKWRVETNDNYSFWRWGNVRYRWQTDGRQ